MLQKKEMMNKGETNITQILMCGCVDNDKKTDAIWGAIDMSYAQSVRGGISLDCISF
jgi:hypothetical protein